MTGTERNADGDTPDTKQDNECAGEDCSAFVLPGETYCMGCHDALRPDGGVDQPGTDHDKFDGTREIPEDYECESCGFTHRRDHFDKVGEDLRCPSCGGLSVQSLHTGTSRSGGDESDV